MDLFAARDQVRRVLNSDEFRTPLVQIMRKERTLLANKKRETNVEFDPKKLFMVELIEFDRKVILERRSLDSHFSRIVHTRLPQPPLISVDDLQQAALFVLAGDSSDYSDQVLSRFTEVALVQIEEYIIGEEFDLGRWSNIEALAKDTAPEDMELAQLENEFELHIESDGRSTPSVTGSFRGACSSSAMKHLTSSLAPIFQSLVKILRLSATSAEMSAVNASNNQLRDTLEIISDSHMENWTDPDGPTIDWLLAMSSVLCASFKCQFASSEFPGRIKIATLFAHYAEMAANNSVAISFCVAAIEAILCRPKEKKTAVLQQRLPAVLCVEESKWDEYELAIANMYNVRSLCFHGTSIAATEVQVVAVKRLLAAIIRAALEWWTHRSKVLSTPSDSDWFAAIPDKKHRAGRYVEPTGVTRQLSEHLAEVKRVFGDSGFSDLIRTMDQE